MKDKYILTDAGMCLLVFLLAFVWCVSVRVILLIFYSYFL